MSLTITEKNHWKERISNKIKSAINGLLAEHDPTFIGRIEQEAKARALELLSIVEPYRRLDEIQEAIKALDTEQTQVTFQLERTLNPSAGNPYSRYESMNRVDRVIQERQDLIKKQLLNASPLGRKIYLLEREQEELLDTIWLATSSLQIKSLWNQVGLLLEQPLTELQSNTLQSVDETN